MTILGMFGGPEIIIIAVVILLLFGGKKLPELMRGLGKGIRDFKESTREIDVRKDFEDVKDEVKSAGKGVEDVSKTTGKPREPFKNK